MTMVRSCLASLALCIVLAAAPVPAAAETPVPPTDATGWWPPGGTLTLQVENDRIASTDRHYTNGLRLGWVSDRKRDGPATVRESLDWLYPLADVKSGRIGFALGHNIYTPEDTAATEPVANDRPYAGWLYVAASIHAETRRTPERYRTFETLDSVELNLGIVGPAALGEEVQNNWHDLIRVERSNGWDNQLENEPTLALFFERKWKPEAFRVAGLEIDAIPHAGGSLGNLLTSVSAGMLFRIGKGLERDFGPPHIRPTFSGLDAVTPGDGLGWYIFGGAEARAVAWDILLDGNSLRSSHSVEKEPFVGDYQLGAALTYGRARVAFTHVFRSRQFEGQRQGDRFGSLSLSVKF